MVDGMRKLSPDEEIEFYKEIISDPQKEKILNNVRDSFQVLYTRSQLLLSLITICLTITGFSGPKIAEANMTSRILIVAGLFFVLLSAVILLSGPLFIKWVHCFKAETFHETIKALIQRRDIRTRKYEVSVYMLVIGLTAYVSSVITYMLNI
jgi:hypothetical protein